jgi:predicted AAA+ superfamily ATPase
MTDFTVYFKLFHCKSAMNVQISVMATIIPRDGYRAAVEQALDDGPVVALLGPRQCGKTTLARGFLAADSSHYFDLEDPGVTALMEQPMSALQPLRGLVVIDEAQRRPELFPILRVLADRADAPAKFLILGSATPELRRQAAESLAGRVSMVEMRGFGLDETGPDSLTALWQRGGFPRSYLARDDAASDRWRRDFVSTFLERDLARLGFGITAPLMLRFWTMLSHYHAQIWNATQLAVSLGVAPNTVRYYLDVLTQTYMIRQLQPWHANLAKRQVKAPKIYFRDSGLFHRLQGIRSARELHTHPQLGASWEGFALEEVMRAARPDEVYFWSVHSGAELDLLMIKDGRRIGVEFKREDAPRATRSMRTAMVDLELERLLVIYPGSRVYQINECSHALPLRLLHDPESRRLLL